MAEDKLITPEEKERLQRQHRHTLKQMRLRRNGVLYHLKVRLET